jgi:predicted thioesterase
VNPMEIKHENLIGTFEQKREQVKQFNLMHDDFFAVVMQDKKALETVLRILLEKDDLIVMDVRVQYVMRNLVGHSVILDVLAEDVTGKLYNVEVQVKNMDDYQRRSRFYQASMDTSFLNKGKHYEELQDIYIIFIASFDIFGKNDVRYEVERTLKGYQEVLDNGVHELYFNTKVKDGSRISKLLHYFEHTDESVDDYGPLSSAVRFFKTEERGVDAVCDEVRKYGDKRAEEAAERADAQAVVRMVSAIMRKQNCSLEEALAMTETTMEQYIASLTLLNMQQSA